MKVGKGYFIAKDPEMMKMMSEYMKENNPSKEPEVAKKISEARKREYQFGVRTPPMNNPETVEKSRKKLKGKPKSEEHRKKIKAMRNDPEIKRNIRKSYKEHDLLCKKYVEKFTKEGYRLVFADLEGYPRPDLIIMKGSKIFAVEVTHSSGENHEKYMHRGEIYDDVLWVGGDDIE